MRMVNRAIALLSIICYLVVNVAVPTYGLAPKSLLPQEGSVEAFQAKIHLCADKSEAQRDQTFLTWLVEKRPHFASLHLTSSQISQIKQGKVPGSVRKRQLEIWRGQVMQGSPYDLVLRNQEKLASLMCGDTKEWTVFKGVHFSGMKAKDIARQFGIAKHAIASLLNRAEFNLFHNLLPGSMYYLLRKHKKDLLTLCQGSIKATQCLVERHLKGLTYSQLAVRFGVKGKNVARVYLHKCELMLRQNLLPNSVCRMLKDNQHRLLSLMEGKGTYAKILADHFLHGKTWYQIAQESGLHTVCIHRIKYKAEALLRKNPWPGSMWWLVQNNQHRLELFLQEKKQTQKNVVILKGRYLQGKTVQQLAEELKKDAGWVLDRLHRAEALLLERVNGKSIVKLLFVHKDELPALLNGDADSYALLIGKYVQRKKVAELQKEFDLSVSGMNKRLHRAEAQLRKNLLPGSLYQLMKKHEGDLLELCDHDQTGVTILRGKHFEKKTLGALANENGIDPTFANKSLHRAEVKFRANLSPGSMYQIVKKNRDHLRALLQGNATYEKILVGLYLQGKSYETLAAELGHTVTNFSNDLMMAKLRLLENLSAGSTYQRVKGMEDNLPAVLKGNMTDVAIVKGCIMHGKTSTKLGKEVGLSPSMVCNHLQKALALIYRAPFPGSDYLIRKHVGFLSQYCSMEFLQAVYLDYLIHYDQEFSGLLDLKEDQPAVDLVSDILLECSA